MSKNATKTIEAIVKEMERYPLEAFDFLHRGLDFTVQRIHGPHDSNLVQLSKLMGDNDISLDDLADLQSAGQLSEGMETLIEQLGGISSLRERMNRHVGGRELCWGLRDCALEQWGLMASSVLKCWGIGATRDFGRMVFALVDNNLLQKQDEDDLSDFEDVYSFDTAFDNAYKIMVSRHTS